MGRDEATVLKYILAGFRLSGWPRGWPLQSKQQAPPGCWRERMRSLPLGLGLGSGGHSQSRDKSHEARNVLDTNLENSLPTAGLPTYPRGCRQAVWRGSRKRDKLEKKKN